ncbi:phosphotransferase [Criblamydia sequanensis]|nr:phosphotransferase [Criblamydia sequanensis]
MKKVIMNLASVKSFVFALIFLIGTSFASENREIETLQIMKDFLKVDEGIQIKELRGGYSGADLFLVDFEGQKFVVRFSNQISPEEFQKEISICEIASHAGYGPKVYLSDEERGFIVMEYLVNELDVEKISIPSLAELAKKIHEGPSFSSSSNIMELHIFRMLDYIYSQKFYSEVIPLDWMERILQACREINTSLESFPKEAPCHGDLHKANLFFSNGQCYAIDYELASMSDPFLDLATLSLSYDFDKGQDNLFLTHYFNREPTQKEQSKLFIMKQLVSLYWGFGLINLIEDGDPATFTSLKKYSQMDELDFEGSEYKLIMASKYLQKALDNFESFEYQEALRILN